MPSFWMRVLLLPFVPRMWSDARSWPAGAVIGPIFVLATLWVGALGLYRNFEFRSQLDGMASTWEENFDPVVMEKGVVRVEGSRLPRGEEKGGLMLVDPEETVPTPTKGTYIIVRKTNVIRDTGPAVDLKQIHDLMGGEPLRIDGPALRGWVDRWGTRAQVGILTFFLFFEWIGVLLGLVYGLMAGAILGSIWGKSRGLSGTQCSVVGIATMAVKPVLGVVMALTGTSVHPCLGTFFWPALGVALGSWALSRLPLAAATPPPPAVLF